MNIWRPRAAVGIVPSTLMLLLAGCGSALQPAPVADKATAEAADAMQEAREVADSAMGKQAEILLQGDLARDGQEQLLVVNRFSKDRPSGKDGDPAPIFVTRAAIFEKSNGKWTEVLRCDERLKNPRGYLRGSPAERVSGWRLEYSQDATTGLEMKFAPADGAASGVESGAGGTGSQTVVVRWNTTAKRYQTFDRSHSRYLTELPALETEPSILK